tara:strand:+ start:272 stop:388 length:117 start_codon:yes stop_codon:yes gene_type:complete
MLLPLMFVLVLVVTVMVEEQMMVVLGEQQAYPYGVPSY